MRLNIQDINGHQSHYYSMKTIVHCTLKPVFKKLFAYLLTYFIVLRKHMTQEFEIQIRDGSVTTPSCAVIRELQKEYDIFQHRQNIYRILNPWVTMLLGNPVDVDARQQIQDIVPKMISKVEANIVRVQSQILHERRLSTNKICSTKCSSPPAIHNLTSIDIPPEILKLLSQGLHIIPEGQQNISELRSSIETELKKAAISHYRTVMGFTPAGASTKLSIDSLMLHLSMNLPCGSPYSEFYFKMRDMHKSGIKGFLSSLRLESKMITPSSIVQSHLPSDIVITSVDKNLGVALIPISWYKLQYEAQCKKGGYIKIHMTEAQCIDHLLKMIQDFWDTCSPEQTKALKKVWPKARLTSFRLGVLKLLPKIHKLGVIDKDSWLILTSRPIRGAEMCPTNAPSLVKIYIFTFT